MLIDLHTHVQASPPEAASFLEFLGRDPGSGLATMAHARVEMAAAGVDQLLVVPWLPAQALVAERIALGAVPAEARAEVLEVWRGYNLWAAGEARRDPGRVLSLVAVDPVLMGEAEVRRLVEDGLAAGAAGLKISPMFLGVGFADPALRVVWEQALLHDVHVLVEAEPVGFRGGPGWGDPRGLWPVLVEFPTLKLQIAHLSRGGEETVVELAQEFPYVHADLAQRLATGRADEWSPERLVATIRAIGVDRVLYGTNYPLGDMRASAAALAALPLSAGELACVAAENALRLLGRC